MPCGEGRCTSSTATSLLHWRGGTISSVKRRLFNVLAAVSLVLCVAMLALWFRSIGTCDSVAYGRLEDAGYSLSTYPGGVEFVATGGLSGAWFGIWTPGWHVSSFAWGTPRIKFSMTSGELAIDMGMAAWTPPPNYLLGFGFDYIRQTLAAPVPAAMSRTHTLTRAVVPFWFLMLLSATPSLLKLRRSLKQRACRKRQRCVQCGYDLRATPDRCPECGSVPEKVNG